NPQPREESEIEASCRKWSYLIPRSNTNLYHPQNLDTKQFFKMGWDLIARDEAGTHQHIITKLGAKTGLAMIKALGDLMDISETEDATLSIFRERTLPFYRIISHPDVLSSLVLETPLDSIYSFLFGRNGQRALSMFRFTARAVSSLLASSRLDGGDLSTDAMTSSLAVLEQLIEINQRAQVIEGFSPIVETIAACIPDEAVLSQARQSLSKIRRRLNIGASLPTATKLSTPKVDHNVSFDLSQDLPGNLSKSGPRHNNDHASISEIQVLPTAQEIRSSKDEYLPSIDPAKHHLPGLAGLLDRQFRLLREDTVGHLRDAVREEYASLLHSNRTKSAARHGNQGARKITYHHVQLLRMYMDRRKGLQVVAEFDQPPQIQNKTVKQREDWWKGSKLLQFDSLLCFVSDADRIIFLTVSSDINAAPQNEVVWKRPDELPSLFRHGKRATALLSMVEHRTGDVIWISKHLGTHLNSRQSLVEFPGVLLPSFQPTLQALQKMSRTLDLPFAEIIAPELQSSDATVMQQPDYTTRRGFKFNLDVLAGEPLAMTPGQAFDFEKLRQGSTLDNAQQSAVIQALSRGLALIQGPPGTGKSYTGVSIIKALLHNRQAADLGPIICVCYTNHALDQLLEHLVKDGVQHVIRLGSRSKSELLQNLNLRHVAHDIVPTKTEKHDKWEHNRDIGEAIGAIEEILSGLNNPKSWINIQDHLAKTNTKHSQELFGRGVDADGFQAVRGKRFRVVDSWLKEAPKKISSNRAVEELLSVSLKEMSTSERNRIHQHWVEQRNAQLAKDLVCDLDAYYNSKSALDKCHQELDLRCLRQAHIIGVTTAGLARNIEVLRRVRAKVMICEEAGEVLEAHILTAFLPGVEHAILIGDHEQLRPQINNYKLQHDNPKGKKFSLDISLFERLVKPQIGNLQVPLSTLKTQRRMHPSIAELIRVPLYPDLQDHPSVLEYPEVVGMRDRLYWLDHREIEDPRVPQAVSLSRTNAFEVDMVAALVSHLVRQGTYGNEDIAVITPYLGQLQQIKKRLAGTFEIVVGDRDLEDLQAQGLQENSDNFREGGIQVQKTTLLNALRIATVDNFQGEEAKVIVVSLVRSNDERNCGFLKTSNRINVLLSRARHGMYIIGNSQTASSVPMWSEVVSLLCRSNNIGTSLALCCPRHTDTPIDVSIPDDFARLAPEGGCGKRCSSRLPCGHACPNMCHSTSLHHAVRCLERCQRVKTGCEHACPKPCGDRCEANCQVILSNVALPCGHITRQLRCYEAQSPEKVLCQVQIEHTMKDCGHQTKVCCGELPLAEDYPCSASCGAALNCGHDCNHDCNKCNMRVDGHITVRTHGICTALCGRPYTTCSHSCKVACHGDSPCALCTELCEVSCIHSKCGLCAVR
ncbi:P-loop containing nucleoside triphosphate hydrolase protein, partial [Bisporella sp. PMI_857]